MRTLACIIVPYDPDPHIIKRLLEALPEDAAVVLVNATTGLRHGFHQHTRRCWMRAHPGQGNTRPGPCANPNGSGTLAPIALFLKLGGLEETLFIDPRRKAQLRCMLDGLRDGLKNPEKREPSE